MTDSWRIHTKRCRRQALMLIILLTASGASILYLAFRLANAQLSDAELRARPTKDDKVTIITAYFNLGTIFKGTTNNVRGPSAYQEWMSAYAYIENPVAAYFDDDGMAQHFTKLREGKPTKTIMVDRQKTWAFSLQARTQSVFEQPGYPQFPPKSTNAAYVCAMHAKYELLLRTVEEDPFGTTYFAWLDVGLFRYLNGPRDNASFTITPPECYRSDAVAFSEVFDISRLAVHDIMRYGIDWVSGAFLLAESSTMRKFCEDYKRRVEDLLYRGLANHDQSVVLSIYAPSSAWKAAVPLQAYRGPRFDPWFYLGYQQRALWLSGRLRPEERPPDGYNCSYTLYK